MGSEKDSILGLLVGSDQKRIYQILDGEVSRVEFEEQKVFFDLVFNHFAPLLGPTWNMIHDPRFAQLESAAMVFRQGRLGGDATVGRQYISSNGQFTSSITDLEQYGEILGEGRHFHNVLQHPLRDCPVRGWLERTWKETTIEPSPDLACTCSPASKIEPRLVKDWSDEQIWALIKQECTNYFTPPGFKLANDLIVKHYNEEPQNSRRRYQYFNRDSERLFRMIKLDLLGLVADYSETPLVDDWVNVDEENTAPTNDFSENPKVAREVDTLEKALTHRAALRAQAAKLLKQLGIVTYLRQMETQFGKDAQLTDMERDNLLKIVYTSNYPDNKPELISALMSYISSRFSEPFEQRTQDQLAIAKNDSHNTIIGLKDGTVKCINAKNELEVPETYEQPEDAIIASILKDPIRRNLYMLFAQAEQAIQDEIQIPNPAKDVCDILRPLLLERKTTAHYTGETREQDGKVVEIFHYTVDDDVAMTEEENEEILTKLVATGFFKKEKKAYSEVYHSTDSHIREPHFELDPKTLEPKES